MSSRRYASIDQFRGFAIFSMVLVNVLGRFPIMPETFRHARFESFSFADSVAPFFFFIVGMGFRIAFLRNQFKQGKMFAMTAALRRFVLLILVGVFVYHFNIKKILWGDALTQIGFGGILALPVIGERGIYRISLPFLYVTLFLVMKKLFGIHVGLELAGWTLLILAGSVVADWMQEGQREFVSRSFKWGVIVSVLGWTLAFFAPKVIFFLAYGLIYMGLSFLLFLLFHYLIDVLGVSLPHMTTLGRNAIVVYVLHYYIDNDMRKLVSAEAGISLSLFTFVVVYVGCYAVARYLENRKYFITM